MLLKLCWFEFRFFTRQPSFYITAATFFILPLLMMSTNRINMAGANTLKNSALSLSIMSAMFTAFGIFLVVNFVANTALRDRLTKMDELLYCKPIQPLSYQLGRLAGAYLVVLSVFALVPVGFWVGSLMPWVDSELMGANQVTRYLLPYVLIAAPGLLALSCVVYAVALRFRSMMAVNLLAVGLFIAYDLSDALFTTPGFRATAALFDPFGIRTVAEVSRYWSMSEKNSNGVFLTGLLLHNRLIWLAIGGMVLVAFGRFHRPLNVVPEKRSRRKAAAAARAVDVSGAPPSDTDQDPLSNDVSHRGAPGGGWQRLWKMCVFEVKQVVMTPSFLILLVMTATLILAMVMIPRGMFGTPNWPVTQLMVVAIQRALGIVMLVVITFYSAEVIWREKELGMGDVIDSLPVPNVVFWLSKLFAVWLVIALMIGFSVCLTISYQLVLGLPVIDLSQYLVSLGLFTLLPFCLLAVLAFLLQVCSSNKYMGMALFVMFIFSTYAMAPLGLSHNLFRFTRAPTLVYSDMNGYGGFLETQLWYMTYWGALAVVMALIGYGLWSRGPEQALKLRLANLRYQLGRRGLGAVAIALLMFVASGGFIFYNTVLLNDYQSASAGLDEQAAYEVQYASFSNEPVPVLTRVNATVDIYPAQRKMIASAELTLENAASVAISTFLVSMPASSSVSRVTIFAAQKAEAQKAQVLDIENAIAAGPLRTYRITLDTAMEPGETRQARFDVERSHAGFVDSGEDFQLVNNGTFINNTELFPVFGYQPGALIADRTERRRHDLPPPQRAHKLEDSRYYSQGPLGNSSGFIDFEATVSTASDQTAIAPGYLQRRWVVADRAYFHYKMDAPMENYYAFLSARLQIAREDYEGVALEVYHHVDHDMNVERMMEALQASLAYYGTVYGPYQHRQARIIEFPGYRSFAQSFANTIPYSEQIGFLSDLRDPEDVDSVYFVTAHEMAHQWWGGQVSGANVQGGSLLSESLAHYSALRVTQNRYGDMAARKILRVELDRYLRERTSELIEELSWQRVENQPYIHYRKGVVVMDAIRARLGETRLNQALANYLAAFKFRDDPYPTSLDLKSHLLLGASIAEQAFINDLFEHITLVELELVKVETSPTETGEFQVALTIMAHQYRADGQGVETSVPFEGPVSIALLELEPDELVSTDEMFYLAETVLKDGENRIEFTVSRAPSFALLDPFIKYVDRNLDNNTLGF
jgi:ABC-2 type transport system permease protein